VGLGNQNDLVGRYFMENITYHSGLFLPSHSVKTWEGLYFKHKVLKEDIPVTIRGALTLSKETVLHENLLNFSATLEPSWSSGSKGVESLKTLLRNIRNRQIPDNLVEHLRNMITDIDDVATTAYYKLFKKEEPPEYEMLVLHNQTEQSPNPDSRVILSDDLDSLGKNRVKLNWQLSDIDRHSIRRAHEIIGEELGRAGLGRMKVQLSDTDVLWGGAHHIGTTRMHSDPRKGVVNENCQIHGISNLFIAGSSVFPTSGATNPTLTIVALALRLADHIKRSMI
jgi:choline dehydrogenase-like flavoprotein